jgi:predicted ATPase/DNA-binding CsgD family transcriptional regulator
MQTVDTELSRRLIEPLTRRERQMLALLAEGYSRPEIAAKLTVGLASVKTHLHHLYGKLGVGTRRQALDRAQVLGLLTAVLSAPAASPTAHLGHNLPLQVTRFFGREAELGQLSDRLDENRLVTLTGSGGVGKTRLSLRVAEDALGEFADGVWQVELAALADPELVPRQVAVALGLPDQPGRPSLELLTAYLRPRQMLLVLDNCEHLLPACTHLAEALLRACPSVKLLATSRQPLGAEGEAVFRVPSLPFPDADQTITPERLAEFPSARLLVDRARLLVPDYQLAAHNAPAILRICRQLDGIPLALELAAARLKLLTAEQVAARLDQALGLLTTGRVTVLPRQRTLQATIGWSFELLTEPERTLLLRLSVFAGGCTLAAAEAVGAGNDLEARQVLDVLTALVDKSLVTAERHQNHETRYRLLETVRQYAHEKLLETGTGERLSQRHAEYFLHFATTNGPQLWYKERPAWLRRFNAERDNLRLALEWSFSSPAGGEIGPRLTVALHPFWLVREYREPPIWFPKAIAYCQDKAATAPALTASVLAYSDYYAPTANLAATQQSVALSRSLGPEGREILLESLGTLVTLNLDHGRDWDQYQALLDEREALIQSLRSDAHLDLRFHLAYNAILRAQAEFERGQFEQATALVLESMRWFEACAHGVNLIWPYRLLGRIANKTGAHAKATEYFSIGLRLAIEDDDARHGQMLIFLCDTAMHQADWAQAWQHCQAFIKLAYEKQTPFWVLERLEMGAIIFIQAGRYPAAARLSGAAEALSDQLGRKTSTETRERFGHGDHTMRYADVSLEALFPDWRTRPDGAAIGQAWQDGRALTYDEVVAHALALSLAHIDGGQC